MARSTSAYFFAPADGFRDGDADATLGKLVDANPFALDPSQKLAWQEEIDILRSALAGVDGVVFLEFHVPRLGSRIDAVLVSGAAIIPIEFKCGATAFERADINQAWDYALDLKNFHEASHKSDVFPILVATKANTSQAQWAHPAADGVRAPRCCNASGLGEAIRSAISLASGPTIDADAWGTASYQPTPTIVQAAQALYANHSVETISRNDAGAKNLRVTSREVEAIVDFARDHGEKAIVFVTGVPGAGKTLVGLNIATRRRDKKSASHAVYLSGNGPLVQVLKEALVRDEVQREALAGRVLRKGAAEQKVKGFIQIVHHFRDEGIRDPLHAPPDRVVIFDEAQRAWDARMTTSFLRKKKKGLLFTEKSEPEFLLSYMNRHNGWAVVVCLVGGGQEINVGEAGISAWLDAISSQFKDWKVFVSGKLDESVYGAEEIFKTVRAQPRTTVNSGLHLASSMRSFRSERVSAFVEAILELNATDATSVYAELSERFPIVLTRDLPQAKAWLRKKARGHERFGMLASSQAMRLKPHAVDVRVKVNPVHWFLASERDTRSSLFLEDAATEFVVQGLELDWTCVMWDADLRLRSGEWKYHSFVGEKWNKVHVDARRRYLINAYRVLLTRARQGMVLFVPRGSSGEHTREPAFYDETYDFLASIGIQKISE